jgi:hypothetical protein
MSSDVFRIEKPMRIGSKRRDGPFRPPA